MSFLYKYQGIDCTIIMDLSIFIETIYCLLEVKYEPYE